LRPAIDETLRIEPDRRCFIDAITARIASSGARKSTCISRSKRFMSRSRSPGNVIAALLTRMSTGPKWSTVAWIICSTSPSLARLVGTASAVPPASVMRRTVSSIVPGIGTGAASVARAAHTTLQPRSAISSAVAAPTPRLAPVTIATFPSRFMKSNPTV
jgi:hypothetical protein